MTKHPPVFPSLTAAICADLADLANPAGAKQLSPKKLAHMLQALNEAHVVAKSSLTKASHADAPDFVAMESALTAALATVELIHQGARAS